MQQLLLLICKENREISQALGENVKVLKELSFLLLPLLEEIGSQKRMLWRNQSLT